MYQPSPEVNRKHTLITIDKSTSMKQDIYYGEKRIHFHCAGLYTRSGTLLGSAPHTGVMKLLVPSKIGPPDRKFWGTMKAGIEE